MANRKSLSDRGVAALRPMAGRYAMPDPELRGHYVRVQPSGAKSFVAVASDPSGKQVWATIGGCDALTIEAARVQAREVLRRVRSGLPAIEPKGETFAAVTDLWLKRHVDAKGLRSAREIRRLLLAHVLPAWGNREFTSIRRSDVAALLDAVEDGTSPRQADYVLNVVRSLMNWFATRHDDYNPPIVRGMKRQSQKAQARARILDDAEIKVIWKRAENAGVFGALVIICLLTAQRRHKVSTMRWQDISIDGEWTIPQEPREKDSAGSLMLPKSAVDIIRAQPRLGENPYVLAGRGNGFFNGYSKAKHTFDAKLPAMAPWVIHDLRRTARSLMSRAGVRPDIAERVLGHAISGVEGVYDRHSYREEKAEALARLAASIEGIINPRANVLPLTTKRGNRQ